MFACYLAFAFLYVGNGLERKDLCRFGATYSFRSLLLHIDWWTKAFSCFSGNYIRALWGGGEVANVSKSLLFFFYFTLKSECMRSFVKDSTLRSYYRGAQIPGPQASPGN